MNIMYVWGSRLFWVAQEYQGYHIFLFAPELITHCPKYTVAYKS